MINYSRCSTATMPLGARTIPSSKRALRPTRWSPSCSSAHPRPLKSPAKALPRKSYINWRTKTIGPFGRQCLLARRLVERGVRFVQIFCGAENTITGGIRPNWDSHEDLPRDHGYWGRVLDGGAAALLKDLKARGLLDETLVICTTEFGRQPSTQGKNGMGRDHNADAFHRLAGRRRHPERHQLRRHRRTGAGRP